MDHKVIPVVQEKHSLARNSWVTLKSSTGWYCLTSGTYSPPVKSQSTQTKTVWTFNHMTQPLMYTTHRAKDSDLEYWTTAKYWQVWTDITAGHASRSSVIGAVVAAGKIILGSLTTASVDSLHGSHYGLHTTRFTFHSTYKCAAMFNDQHLHWTL